MLFRAIAKFLNSDAADLAGARRDYDQIKDYMRRRRLIFRKNALEWIGAVHVDVRFLLNEHCNTFMAYAPRDRILKVGVFADPTFPRIEFFGSNATADELKGASEKAQRDIASFDAFLGSGELDSADPDGRQYIEAILTRGYFVLQEVPADRIFRGVLLKDDHVLGFSDFWNPQPDGFFTDLLRRYVHQAPLVESTASVEFRIDFLNDQNKRNYCRYVFHYSQMRPNIPELVEEFSVNVGAVASFASSLEPVFKTPLVAMRASNRPESHWQRGLSDITYRVDEDRAFMGNLG